MTPKLSETQRMIRDLIKERPGISATDIKAFFDMKDKDWISAQISVLWQQGGIRRQPDPKVDRSYRYWMDPNEGPKGKAAKAKKPSAPKKPTPAACEVMLEEARERIAELEAWQAEAIRRFPDLAVDPVVLKARKIVADEYKNDKAMQIAIMGGHKDDTPVMRATVRALEM